VSWQTGRQAGRIDDGCFPTNTPPARPPAQGEARGGLLEVTRKKEEEVARREAELAKR
jgi:hypothetical protein